MISKVSSVSVTVLCKGAEFFQLFGMFPDHSQIRSRQVQHLSDHQAQSSVSQDSYLVSGLICTWDVISKRSSQRFRKDCPLRRKFVGDSVDQMGLQCHVFRKTSVLPLHADDLPVRTVLLPAGAAVQAVSAPGIQFSTTRCPISVSSSDSSTTPTNSCPITPRKLGL